MNNSPRFMLCAPNSGGGKTMVTCAILQALVNRNMNPVAFKCGPDYIDPMFHSRIIGAKSRNLDLFMMGREMTKSLFLENSILGEISVIEGVMGYYDGIAMSSAASSWDLAQETKTPAILVLDGRGRALSAAAEVLGFLKYKEQSMIEGVIINRISEVMYHRMAEMIESEIGIKVFGFLPEMKDFIIESRHLGLVTANEITDLKEKLQTLAAMAEKTIDLKGLIKLANSAPILEAKVVDIKPEIEDNIKIAVARDDAFCFYYEDAINLLNKLGAETVYFSPLKDPKIPDGISALYIGGGYPELYAKELSENHSMIESIKTAILGKMPTIAECGGFMYLCHDLEDDKGNVYPMLGIIDSRAYRTNRLSRFGYIEMTAQKDGLLAQKGDKLFGHEFHYWDCDKSGADFRAEKPKSTRIWDCAFSDSSLYAGYPHIHMCSNDEIGRRFVRKAYEWSKND